ncbi:MAG: hypothetical protein PHF86_00235 [Candidatus Nanoarchaeia archaeon]|nr:hypothetical protein [Candidatus Nanoarchaeia archaeon]
MWISHKNPSGTIKLIDLRQIKEIIFYEEASKFHKDTIYHMTFYYKRGEHTTELIFNLNSDYLKVVDLINKELGVINLDTIAR